MERARSDGGMLAVAIDLASSTKSRVRGMGCPTAFFRIEPCVHFLVRDIGDPRHAIVPASIEQRFGQLPDLTAKDDLREQHEIGRVVGAEQAGLSQGVQPMDSVNCIAQFVVLEVGAEPVRRSVGAKVEVVIVESVSRFRPRR